MELKKLVCKALCDSPFVNNCPFHFQTTCLSYFVKTSSMVRSFLSAFQSLSKRNFTKYVAFLLCMIQLFQASWAAGVVNSPIIRTDATKQDDYHVFTGEDGNSKGNNLHFQLLKFIESWKSTTNVLLVSGRDYVYMIDPSNNPDGKRLPYLERLQWRSTNERMNECKRIKSQYECHNFIRVVELLQNNTLFVCGTNAYAPTCRSYSRDGFTETGSNSVFYSEDNCRGNCETPYSPLSSVVAMYTSTTHGYKRIFAHKGGFLGNYPGLTARSEEEPVITSEGSWFEDPWFVKMLKYKNGKTYLFFVDIEIGGTMATVSRIAQVCTNDTGGETILEEQWTSFLTARLKCSFSNDGSSTEEFRYDNLTSVSDVVQITHNGKKVDAVYATFTTPKGWSHVSLSAVCVYTMDAIIKLFDTGSLGNVVVLTPQASAKKRFNIEVLTFVEVQPPNDLNKRPGSCTSPTDKLKPPYLSYMKKHPLIFDPILSLYKEPAFVSDNNVRMTSIAVDSSAGSGNHTILYIGTQSGKLMRIRPRNNEDEKSVFLDEMRVSEEERCLGNGETCSVHDLYIFRPVGGSKANPALFVAYTDRIVRIPLALCHQYFNEICCNVDPECGWNGKLCVPRSSENSNLPSTIDAKNLPKHCEADLKDPEFHSLTGCAGSMALTGIIVILVTAVIALTVIFIVKRRKPSSKISPQEEKSEKLTDEYNYRYQNI